MNYCMGSNIKAIRKEKGIKAIDVANALGITSAAVAQIENQTFVRRKTLEKMSELLDVSCEYIIHYDVISAMNKLKGTLI